MDTLERHPGNAAAAIIPLSGMLLDFPSLVLTAEGVQRALHGRGIGPADTEKGVRPLFPEQVSKKGPHPFFRLLDQAGELLAIAEPVASTDLLHPSIAVSYTHLTLP